MLEVAEKTVSRSFLCLGFVVSQSVMPAEQTSVLRGGKVLLPHVYVNVVACSENNSNNDNDNNNNNNNNNN